MINSDPRFSADISDDTMRRIILALFNPMPDGHEKGCLAHDPHIHPRGPCICKYGEAAGEYLWALREAKKIASEHYGQKEVEESRRLEEPVGLVEAAALVATVAQSVQVRQIQEIYDAVNALGGRSDQDNSYDQGIVDTVGKVLAIIEPHLAAQPPAAPVETDVNQIQYVIEGIVLRRLYEKRIEGYTIETAKEIAQAIVSHPRSSADTADDLRAAGWTVAVHNDYRLNGERHTFWLFTKDGQAIKGEGRTDREALDQCRALIRTVPQPALRRNAGDEVVNFNGHLVTWAEINAAIREREHRAILAMTRPHGGGK